MMGFFMDYRAKLRRVSPDDYKRLRRFDMERRPYKQWHILRPLTWLLSFPSVWKRRLRVHKRDMEKIKPPFILLCNHMAFIDFKVTTAALFPWRSNYVVAIDGFIGREGLLRFAGGILKRRVTSDVFLIRHLRTILHQHKNVVSIYPEARYSLIGVPAYIPHSLGKLLKRFKLPVVMLRMHGNYLSSPVWNLRQRKTPIEAELFRLFTPEDLLGMDTGEIHQGIRRAFEYDEYAWQRDRGIHITEEFRAEGLHHVIYRCPACETEFAMRSRGSILECGHCGKQWRMTSLGQMEALDGPTEFSHLPDWYQYQVEQVRREIEAGRYRFEDEVRVESLVNNRGYYFAGNARVVHDNTGFTLQGDPAYFSEIVHKSVRSMYSCHIEYDYFGKGDCFELSTMNDTYYLYPLNKVNVVTKILIATEELHQLAQRKESARMVIQPE